MPPLAVYQPRKKIITSYVSEYVDREDLKEMLDKEFRFEDKGVTIFEYYIHTEKGFHKIEAPRAITDDEKEWLKALWASRQPSSNIFFQTYAEAEETEGQ